MELDVIIAGHGDAYCSALTILEHGSRDIFHAPLPVTEDLFLCGFIRRTVARLMLIWSCFFVCFSVCLAGESQLCRCRAALTYARQTWPMISESALACHTYFSVPHLLQRATPTSACHTHFSVPHLLQRATPTSACHTYFSVPHPLQRATPTVTQDVRIRGHLRGPAQLTPVAERFAVELSLRVLTT